MTLEELIRKIVGHMCTHYEDYTSFHIFDESPLPLTDTLIEDAMEYFKHSNYMHDIVDLLMQITADALHLNPFIYQQAVDNIQVLNFQNILSNRVVHVCFMYDNLNSAGNHYDSIICVRPQVPSPSVPSTSRPSSMPTTTQDKENVAPDNDSDNCQQHKYSNLGFQLYCLPPSYATVMED